MESLLGSLAGRRVAELESLKAKSSKKGSDWTIDDKNSIYKDLEELARLQDALLKEMEGYEDYEEPNNEDLANKLKDLKFEVGLAKETEEILEESNERKRRRKKDKKTKSQLELEDDIEASRVFNELEAAVMKAEAEGRIDSSEKDRLLAELEELKKKQEDEVQKRREQQQKLLQARLLEKRLQGKKTFSNRDISSQATGADNQAMMVLAENEAVMKENDAYDTLKMELDLEIDTFEKQAEKELQALETEYKKELAKNPSSEEAARLLADLEAKKNVIEERRKRQLKAALAARNAKLAMAKKRKETAESEALLQSANSMPGQDKDENSEKEAILEAVTNGEQLEDAIYKVLRTRHAKEQKDLAERHQREIEILRNKCLNDVRDDRHDERERIIGDHQKRMMELSTVDDDSYDEQAMQAEKKFNQLLETFDNETENLASQQAAEMIEGRKMEQSGESVGLLERQMSEIQQAIQDCSVDEQIKYERDKMAKKQQKQLKKLHEEQATKKSATEKTELEKQEAKYKKKRERLEAEMRKEKEILQSKDEAERKKLEDAIKRQQERDELNQQQQRQEIINNESDKTKQAKLLADLEENSKKLEAERKAASDKSRSELEKRIAERRKNDANKQKKEKEIFEEKIKAKTERKSEKRDEQITEDAKTATIVNQATTVPEEDIKTTYPNYSSLLLESGIVGDLDYVNKVLKSVVSTDENPKTIHLVEAFKVDDDSLSSVSSSGAVKIVNPRELAAKEFVTFRFCLRQMQELQEVFKFQDIRVFVSENLPENDNVHQMKKIYVFKNGLCLVHREALKSVGIVSIIAAHLGSF